ncbi:alpha/beta hydrolase [Streptomyces sp. NPDC087532]|uniref:alpha/beta hydrolase n=1 Tax=Streptomyces sp. NPDC087532 TaxID=3365795 RepID=UPI00382E6D41
MHHGPARPNSLPPPPSHYLPRPDDARLALYTDGPDAAPVTVVLAHGWCATVSIWDDHARHLATRGIRVIRYDQRGHGASLTGTSIASARLLADELAAVLRHTRRCPRVVVAGHSMGGMGVLHLAAPESYWSPPAPARWA